MCSRDKLLLKWNIWCPASWISKEMIPNPRLCFVQNVVWRLSRLEPIQTIRPTPQCPGCLAHHVTISFHFRFDTMDQHRMSVTPWSDNASDFFLETFVQNWIKSFLNFKNGKSDLQCRLCKAHVEDQESLLTCKALNGDSSNQASEKPVYSDIFSENIGKLTAITKVLHQKFDNFTNQVNRQATKPSSSATDVIGTVSSNTAVSDNDVDLE